MKMSWAEKNRKINNRRGTIIRDSRVGNFDGYGLTLVACKKNVYCVLREVPKYGVFSGPNTRKCGPEKTSFLDFFHAVVVRA